ncbi:MAG: hypothetical protein HY367_04105 [Candidatus Aenigmarchaeota archaeon]|nr:hypothetical protein [Candidatus Aenigmarchaeota archaeon]
MEEPVIAFVRREQQCGLTGVELYMGPSIEAIAKLSDLRTTRYDVSASEPKVLSMKLDDIAYSIEGFDESFLRMGLKEYSRNPSNAVLLYAAGEKSMAGLLSRCTQ